jgi:hypothetical protein
MPIGNKSYKVAKGITKGYPTHIKNNDGGLYGDYTKKAVDAGGTGSSAMRGILNKHDANTWEYPKPTTGKR